VIISKKELDSFVNATCATPHNFLGMHKCKGGIVVRAYLINAQSAELVDLRDEMNARYPMDKLDDSGFFEVFIKGARKFFPYRFRTTTFGNEIRQNYDPYSYMPSLSDDDIFLIGKGDQHKIYEKLGGHLHQMGETSGVRFAVWAPTARRVSLVGQFNEWDGRYNPMRMLGNSGIWEIFIPNLKEGAKYKYEIVGANSKVPFLKTDPYALSYEPQPYNSAIVCDISKFEWGDGDWLKKRLETNWLEKPISIYEVHLGSWMRNVSDANRPLSYVEIAPLLANYCKNMNFTHVEFMPLAEHPFEGSWGYQVTGFFAPTFRYGTPEQFMYLVDYLHRENIGVIMDWVPAHFPKDSFALAKFDGSCLYEHEDARQGEHQEWGTLCFNYARCEVRNFLVGSALSWIERFHIDGLRVDAVASMLYLNYARKDGEWVANCYGGNENLEAIEFLKNVNALVHLYHKGVLMIAEESTAFPALTKPVSEGGIGFDLKWNLGWMHDTLAFLKEDPINRKYHHHRLTFPGLYQFTENFVSVYSHDEVVHGKSSMINKMGSGYWNDKASSLRGLFAYMWFWPGKKTLFMGSEFGQSREWKYDESLDWHLLKYKTHSGICDALRDVSSIYLNDEQLAKGDLRPDCFRWINCDDKDASVISFLRYGADDKNSIYAIVCNFTPMCRHGYKIGLPKAGEWKEVFNSDAEIYGGNNIGNAGAINAVKSPYNDLPCSANVILPALSTIIFKI